MTLSNLHLVLFLTEGTRLADWQRIGLLEREAELYLRLRPQVGSIAWVSYGGRDDLAYQRYLPDIEILYNRWRLPNQVYIQQLPWLHWAAFERATLLKAEQTGAAQAALRVAQHFGKRYLARSGFSLALFSQYAPQDYATDHQQILDFERQSFIAAQQIVVTTEEMRQTALNHHPIDPAKIHVIPNYVNTTRFHPAESPPTKPRILFAGRLTAQKNVDELLTAVAPLQDVEVVFIGSGDLQTHLEQRIAAENLTHVRLVGNIPNHDLPQYFQSATLYLQPSLYEGHPKTIFEAMACGLPVVVADVVGIRQFVQHGVTGWLCSTEAESIRAGILNLLADADLRQTLGGNARCYVVENFSLDQVVTQELAVLEHILRLPPLPAQPQPRPVLRSLATYAARVVKLLRH